MAKQRVNYGLALINARNTLKEGQESRQATYDSQLSDYKQLVKDSAPGKSSFDENSGDWTLGTTSQYWKPWSYSGSGPAFQYDRDTETGKARGGNSIYYRPEYTSSGRYRGINAKEVRGNPLLEAGQYDSLSQQEQIESTLGDIYNPDETDFVESDQRQQVQQQNIDKDTIKQRSNDIIKANQDKVKAQAQIKESPGISGVFSQIGSKRNSPTRKIDRQTGIKNKLLTVRGLNNGDDEDGIKLKGKKIK